MQHCNSHGPRYAHVQVREAKSLVPPRFRGGHPAFDGRPTEVRIKLWALLLCFLTMSGWATTIGTNPSPAALSPSDFAALPESRRNDWTRYLADSERALARDKEFLQKELNLMGLSQPIRHNESRQSGLPLERSLAWFGDHAAGTVGDNILSFQTPSGGWSKHLDFGRGPRAKGQSFAPTDPKQVEPTWDYVGTFDNDGTTKPMRFLARLVTARGAIGPYYGAFLRGLDYIFDAQAPSGGWPQVFPLSGSYHDAITYNDGAMIKVLSLLQAVIEAKDDFAFVPPEYRHRAAECVKRARMCILRTQIISHGKLCAWAQQHSQITLLPTPGRTFEMCALSTAESASVAIYLMRLKDPTNEELLAIRSAVSWLRSVAVNDVEYGPRGANSDRILTAKPGAGPLWPRFIDIETSRPVFGDRDGTIHDDLGSLSAERRNGYAWFSSAPGRALTAFAEWEKLHPSSKP